MCLSVTPVIIIPGFLLTKIIDAINTLVIKSVDSDRQKAFNHVKSLYDLFFLDVYSFLIWIKDPKDFKKVKSIFSSHSFITRLRFHSSHNINLCKIFCWCDSKQDEIISFQSRNPLESESVYAIYLSVEKLVRLKNQLNDWRDSFMNHRVERTVSNRNSIYDDLNW